MAWIRFGNNHWLQTDHIDRIIRNEKTLTTGTVVEGYTLLMDNYETVKLTSAEGDFVVANLGSVLDGPDRAARQPDNDPQD